MIPRKTLKEGFSSIGACVNSGLPMSGPRIQRVVAVHLLLSAQILLVLAVSDLILKFKNYTFSTVINMTMTKMFGNSAPDSSLRGKDGGQNVRFLDIS